MCINSAVSHQQQVTALVQWLCVQAIRTAHPETVWKTNTDLCQSFSSLSFSPGTGKPQEGSKALMPQRAPSRGGSSSPNVPKPFSGAWAVHSGQSRMKTLEAAEQCPGGWILPWPQESQKPSPCRSGNTWWGFYGFEKNSPLHSVHSLWEYQVYWIMLSGMKVVSFQLLCQLSNNIFHLYILCLPNNDSVSTQCQYIYNNKISIHCFLIYLRNYLLTGLSTLRKYSHTHLVRKYTNLSNSVVI